MSTFEGAYTSLLQGVSQQVAALRLPGQVSAAENSLFDPVTGWRRRPGAEVMYHLDLPGENKNSIHALETDMGGFRVQIIIGTATGTVKVLGQDYSLLKTLQDDYLIATSAEHVQFASVGDEMFLLNKEHTPTQTAGAWPLDPTKCGFFYVTSGAFSKAYSCTVKVNGTPVTGTYTTPASTDASAAEHSLPEYITSQVQASLVAAGLTSTHGVDMYRVGPYLFFSGPGTLTSDLLVSTDAGANYATASGASAVRTEANLPARLADEANGYIVSVGTQPTALVYYQYNADSASWLECGDYQSPGGFSNVPISLKYSGSDWVLDTSNFEGRLAGDNETNPIPKMVDNGITGLSSYQGRLCLLCGSFVGLSSSDNPRRFMRSSVISLLDSDPVWIGSSANSSAAYEYAVQFQKDLILFSAKYQALIPGSNVAITPRTATVLITSSFRVDTSSPPLPIGRTLLYPAPLSSEFFGIMEMIPSEFTDSQYISMNSTSHLPKYMAGTCRFSASSAVSSTVLFGQSGDTKGLIAYQYLWSGSNQEQKAWSRWSFEHDIANVYFQGEEIMLLFYQNGMLVGAKVDPKAGVVDSSTSRRPFLDLYSTATVVDSTFTVPAWMLTFDPDIAAKLKFSLSTGGLAGEEVGIKSVVGDLVTMVRSFPAGDGYIGVPYQSLLSPTPPLLLDHNGKVVNTNKMTVLRFGITVDNSSAFKVEVFDSSMAATEIAQGVLTWQSTELDLGSAVVASQSRVVVPARTRADSTTLLIYTSGLGELNVVSIDYACRYHQKLRRQ